MVRWRLCGDLPLCWRFWDDEFVVYHPASGNTHWLNVAAAEVLKLLESAPASTSQMVTQLTAAFEAPADQQLWDHVERLCAELDQLGLIEAVA
jgi:PqqD family protein of HPr-rel-A system